MQDSRNARIGTTILNGELPLSSSVSSNGSKHAKNNGIRNRIAFVRSSNTTNDIESEYNHHNDDDDIFVVCQPHSNKTSSGTGTQSDGTVQLAGVDNTKDHHNEEAQYLDQNMDLQKYPIKELKIYIYGLQDPIVFNPFVTLIGVSLLWGVVIWTLVNPTDSLDKIVQLRATISLHFTWLFIGTKAFLFFFIMYVYFKYGHIKLGHQKDEPEFTILTYTCMIFATGVASGFFVFAVAEPLYHQHNNFYVNTGYRSQDEIDMFALNLTVSNWGITGWTSYTIVAVCMALATHRFKLPLSARSCFYPILRHYTWGWIGDIIDGLTIVISVGGMCTSLGLGAIEIVSGLIYLGWVDKYSREDQITSIVATTVWVITIICTASVISGVHGGIRLLSIVAIVIGLFLLCLVLFLDDTKFLLNLIVQETGYYLQNSIFVLNFWTDAFGQLREGSGRAIDGNAADEWWMDAWGVFYVAWWVSWSGFVGLLIARISRGRTVGELILYSLIVPILVCLVWFSIWGGIGLRQSRQGMELEALGGTYFNNTAHYLVPGSEFCYEVPQDDVVVNDEIIFTNHLPGITPVCQFDSSKASTAAFNVLYSFSFPDTFPGVGYGPILSVIYIIALMLFFVTSSDSGSLIVDQLSSNGGKSHHWIRRMFWSITQGALATALLSTGGNTALKAVQAASIVCGLPFLVLLLFNVQCIHLLCRAADKLQNDEEYEFPDQSEFETPVYGGILNIMEYLSSLGRVNKARVDLGIHRPTISHLKEFLKGVFVPFISMYEILSLMNPTTPYCLTICLVLIYALSYYGWIAIYFTSWSHPGLEAWSVTFFVISGAILGKIRSNFRYKYNIRSNIVADFLSGLLLWPQVLTQMQLYYVQLRQNKAEDDELPKPWIAEVSDSQSLPSS